MGEKYKYILYIILSYVIIQSPCVANIVTWTTSLGFISLNSSIYYMIPLIDSNHIIDILFANVNHKFIYPFNLDLNISNFVDESILKLLSHNHDCDMTQCIMYKNILIKFNRPHELYFINSRGNISYKELSHNTCGHYVSDVFEINLHDQEFIFKNHDDGIIYRITMDDIINIVNESGLSTSVEIETSRLYDTVKYITIEYDNYDIEYVQYLQKMIDKNEISPSFYNIKYNNTNIAIIQNGTIDVNETITKISNFLQPVNISYISTTTLSTTTLPTNAIYAHLNLLNTDESDTYVDNNCTCVTNHVYYFLNSDQFIIFIIIIIIITMIYYINKILYWYNNTYIKSNETFVKYRYYKKNAKGSDLNNSHIQSTTSSDISTPNIEKNNEHTDNTKYISMFNRHQSNNEPIYTNII